MHKCVKDEQQSSGRGLLLTISTSIDKYLYVGEIRQKTHPMSKETHSSVQSKGTNHSATRGITWIKGPTYTSKPTYQKLRNVEMGLGDT